MLVEKGGRAFRYADFPRSIFDIGGVLRSSAMQEKSENSPERQLQTSRCELRCDGERFSQ
jgi:hypothetical protein